MGMLNIDPDRINAIAGTISAGAAAIALAFNAIALWQANHSRNLDLFDRVFSSIAHLEESLQDIVTNPARPSENYMLLSSWRSLLLNRLEYFAFLVNKRYLKDECLVGFFKETIIRWHEEIFLKLGDKSEKEDPKIYPELKSLYMRLSKEQRL